MGTFKLKASSPQMTHNTPQSKATLGSNILHYFNPPRRGNKLKSIPNKKRGGPKTHYLVLNTKNTPLLIIKEKTTRPKKNNKPKLTEYTKREQNMSIMKKNTYTSCKTHTAKCGNAAAP